MKTLFIILIMGQLYGHNLYAEPAQIELAPGYSPLAFKIPEVGSYALPVIGTAAD